MKLLFALTIIFSYFFQACSAIKFEKYYPAIANKQIILSFSQDSPSNKISYQDTLICRVRNAGTFKYTKDVRKGIAILSPNAQVQGAIKPIAFFFFEHPNHTLEDSIYIADNSFAGLSYCFYRKKLYMGWMTSKNQKVWQEFFVNVFPRAITMGVNYFYRAGDAKQTFAFIGREDVEVNNMKYKDCLMLTVNKNFNAVKGNDTIWFAKNVGIVKWARKTGYTGLINID